MRRFVVALSVVAVAALGAAGCGDKGSDSVEVFQADLSGANEVPARGTAAHGSVGFTFDGTNLNYSVELDDTSGIDVGHIHSGAAGVNGPVRVFLYPAPPAPGVVSTPIVTSDKSVVVTGTITAANVTGIGFDQLISEMRAGNAYANFHSRTFPGGEIRGQVRLLSVD
jgi:hypothetical protein